MSKRWTVREDQFLAMYFDAMGDYIGEHDLGKPKGAATKRVKKLKDCGAWDALKAGMAAQYTHHRAYLLALGKHGDVEMLDMASPGAPADAYDRGGDPDYQRHLELSLQGEQS